MPEIEEAFLCSVCVELLGQVSFLAQVLPVECVNDKLGESHTLKPILSLDQQLPHPVLAFRVFSEAFKSLNLQVQPASCPEVFD